MRHVRSLITLVAALAAFAATSAPAAELATYTARYDLVLEELKIPGEVVAWKGAAAVQVSRDCQKWVARSEVAFALSLATGQTIKFRSVERYYESFDGDRLEFEIISKTNGSVTVHRKGVLVLEGKGKPGHVTYSKPRGVERDIPAGTDLPISGTLALVNSLARGKREWRQQVFDKGEMITYSHTLDKKGVSLKKQPEGDTQLTKFSGWRVNSTARLAESREDLHFEMLLHPNGLASQIVSEQQFAVLGYSLNEIETVRAPDC